MSEMQGQPSLVSEAKLESRGTRDESWLSRGEDDTAIERWGKRKKELIGMRTPVVFGHLFLKR